MTRRPLYLFAALVLLLAVPATAGVLEVVCVAPTMDADGACDSLVAIPRWSGAPLTIHLVWQSAVRGGSFGHDSLAVAPGDTLTFSRWIPAGQYRYWLYASDAGGEGCRTEGLYDVRGWPGMVRRVKP